MMSNYDIDVRPNMFESFLDVFDLMEDNGDIVYALDNYHSEKIVPNDVYEIMVTSGFGIWGVAGNNPALLENIEIEVIEHNKAHYLLFNMAAFLGLPADNPQSELLELKELLVWLKDESLKHPQYKVKLALSRDDTNTEIKISSSSSVLQQQLQNQLDNTINASPVLQAWAKNQKESFLLTEKHCSSLFASMDCSSLLNMSEKIKMAEKEQPVKVPPPRKSFW